MKQAGTRAFWAGSKLSLGVAIERSFNKKASVQRRCLMTASRAARTPAAILATASLPNHYLTGAWFIFWEGDVAGPPFGVPPATGVGRGVFRPWEYRLMVPARIYLSLDFWRLFAVRVTVVTNRVVSLPLIGGGCVLRLVAVVDSLNRGLRILQPARYRELVRDVRGF